MEMGKKLDVSEKDTGDSRQHFNLTNETFIRIFENFDKRKIVLCSIFKK